MSGHTASRYRHSRHLSIQLIAEKKKPPVTRDGRRLRQYATRQYSRRQTYPKTTGKTESRLRAVAGPVRRPDTHPPSLRRIQGPEGECVAKPQRMVRHASPAGRFANQGFFFQTKCLASSVPPRAIG